MNYLIVAAFGGYFTIRGIISVGDIQAIIQYSRQFSQPINQIANQYAESLGQITGFAVLISDREQIIACYGVGKADVLNKPVTKEIEERLNEREFIFAKEGEKGFAEIVEGYGDYKEEMAAPIIAGGDYIGGVFLLSKTEKGKLTMGEKKLLLTAASFLAKQMEE